MILTRSVLFFVILSTWSIHPSESSSDFLRSLCRDTSVPGVRGLVIGSEVAPREERPWLVALFVKRYNKFFCAGSLVSKRCVLTAAHCIQDKKVPEPRDPKDVNVYLGKWNLSDATEQDVVLATPKKFIVHHDWNVTDTRWDADIAIVQLADDVTFSKSVKPVCLWTSQMQSDKANDGGIVVGWGKTEKVELSEVPREVVILRLPIIDCYEIYGLRDVISRRGLCIGGNGKGPCSGDSGGGFFTFQGGKWFLRGITSVSRLNVAGECDVIAPVVFTNVEKFIPWIDQILDGDEQMKCKFFDRWFYYECYLQNSFTRKDTDIFQVSGSHVGGRRNADVRRFTTENNKELKFLPITFGQFFPNLERYEVENSGLKMISRNNFADFLKLKDLVIRNSTLKVIPMDVFSDLTNLETLNLHGNQIKAIDSDTFIHNTKLQVIELQDNKITSLGSATFRNNLELIVINFSNNLLTSIGPDLMMPLEKINIVNFRRNPCIDKFWGKVRTLTPSERKELKESLAKECQ